MKISKILKQLIIGFITGLCTVFMVGGGTVSAVGIPTKYDQETLKNLGIYFVKDTGNSCSAGDSAAPQPGQLDIATLATKYGLQSAIVKEVKKNVVASYQADQPPIAVASVLKLIIADVFLSGKPDLNRTVAVTAQENYFGAAGGDGSLSSPKTGQTIKLADALAQTLKFSSDTQANVLIDAAGGLQSATNTAKSLGYGDTSILSYYNDAGRPTIGPNTTTVIDLTNAMEKIYTSTDTTYQSAHAYLHEDTVKYGLNSDANKWGGTSKVSGNSAVFEVNGAHYIVTMYIEKDWKGDAAANNPASGAYAIKSATNDIISVLQNSTPANSSNACCASTVSGSNNEAIVWNYLVSQMGFSAVQAAGIMGNMQQESPGFNPANTNDIGAHGIAQWFAGRRTSLQKFAADRGTDENDLATQLDFLKTELGGKYKASVLDPIKKTDDLEEVTRIWLMYFEVPCLQSQTACINKEMSNRLPNAQDFLSRLGSGTSPATISDNAQSSCGSANVTDGYSLPVDRHWYDEHKDWFTKPHHDYAAADIPVPEGTNAYAITSGTVTGGGASDVGGDCGNGISIDGDDGAKYLYCHGSDGGTVDGAHRGDHVSVGQLIMHVSHTGHVEPPGPAGAHLHVGILVNGVKVCPQTLLVGIAEGNIPDVLSLTSSGCSYGNRRVF